MKRIGIRVTDESVKFVRREAGRRATAESEIWRELIELGIHRSDEVLSQLERLSKLVVQSLCMSQRVAEHVKPDLVEKARADARLLIARMNSSREALNGS